MLHLPEKMRSRVGKILVTAFDILISLLIASGIAPGLMKGIFGTYPVSNTLLCIAAGVLLCFIPEMLPRFRWLFRAAVILSQVLLYFLGKGCFFALEVSVRALILSRSGCSLLPYTGMLCALSGLFTGLTAAAMVKRRMGSSCLLLCMAAMYALVRLSGDARTVLPWAVVCAGGLGLLLCRTAETKKLSVIPLVAVLLVTALLLTPDGLVWDKAEVQKKTVQQAVHDYLLYTSDRTSFSLETEGYMPLSDRLGGAAEPSDRTALKVTADRKVHLRAVSKDAFNGLNWYDTLGSHRYLYMSGRYSRLRQETFDTARPLVPDQMREQTVTVEIMSPASTTLYVPQRITGFSSRTRRMVLYWNEGSELFITRDLEAGDTYTVSWLPYAAGDPETEISVARCAYTEDEHYAAVAAQYLTVPGHTQQEIYYLGH